MGCSACKDKRGEGEEIKSYEDLEKAVAKGRKLVVYEDIVIDVTNFIAEHPGGAQTLEQYVGKGLESDL